MCVNCPHIQNNFLYVQHRRAHSTGATTIDPRLAEMAEKAPKPQTGCDELQPKLFDSTALQFSECPI